MSQFTSGFWDIYIAALTLLSVVACAVLLKMQSSRKVSGGSTETTGHTWDEDLGEYNNPLPQWWMWLFYITIVFGLVYLYLYPVFLELVVADLIIHHRTRCGRRRGHETTMRIRLHTESQTHCGQNFLDFVE